MPGARSWPRPHGGISAPLVRRSAGPAPVSAPHAEIGALAAAEQIAAGAADQLVLAASPAEEVVCAQSLDLVRAAQARDHVPEGPTLDRVLAGGPVEGGANAPAPWRLDRDTERVFERGVGEQRLLSAVCEVDPEGGGSVVVADRRSSVQQAADAEGRLELAAAGERCDDARPQVETIDGRRVLSAISIRPLGSSSIPPGSTSGRPEAIVFTLVPRTRWIELAPIA